jgi:hypothetical protein
VDALREGHKAEQLRPREQLVHTNLSLFYMKSGDKVKAEHHGLQARVAGWRENMTAPGSLPAEDAELQIAKPAPPPAKAPVKFPEMPWKKKPAEKPAASAPVSAPGPSAAAAPSPTPDPPAAPTPPTKT